MTEKNVEDIQNFLTGYNGQLGLLQKRNELDQLYHNQFDTWTMKYLENIKCRDFHWSQKLNSTISDKNKAYNLFYDIVSDFFVAYLEKSQELRIRYAEEKEIHTHLNEMIGYIKRRPLMFITSKKVENIECFLRGTGLAIQLYDEKTEFDEIFEKDFCKWTKDWLCMNRGLCFDEEYSKWSCYIRQASEDDEASFNLFFEIEEEFEQELQNRGENFIFCKNSQNK